MKDPCVKCGKPLLRDANGCSDPRGHETECRRMDQMDRLTRVFHEMCGETADLRALAGVVADTLAGVWGLRKAGVSADECVARARASLFDG